MPPSGGPITFGARRSTSTAAADSKRQRPHSSPKYAAWETLMIEGLEERRRVFFIVTINKLTKGPAHPNRQRPKTHDNTNVRSRARDPRGPLRPSSGLPPLASSRRRPMRRRACRSKREVGARSAAMVEAAEGATDQGAPSVRQG